MTQSERDLYYVAVKAFLENEGKLFIFKDKFGDWDLPGGRIQKHEFENPLTQVLERKIREELGNKVKYKLGNPVVFMRHEREEKGSKVRIFAIGYRAVFLGGEIKLSELHTESEWVPIKTFDPATHFTDGWLKGVENYLRFHREKIANL